MCRKRKPLAPVPLLPQGQALTNRIRTMGRRAKRSITGKYPTERLTVWREAQAYRHRAEALRWGNEEAGRKDNARARQVW